MHRIVRFGAFFMSLCMFPSVKGEEHQFAGISEGAGAGAVVVGTAGAMLEALMGVLIEKDANMLRTQMKTARPQVSFSMKSVVLRYPRYWFPCE